MTEAWEYIYNQDQVTVSIDTYYFCLVWFRKEQPNNILPLGVTLTIFNTDLKEMFLHNYYFKTLE